MDDTIEICSGCGKMPRAIDSIGGMFTCTRCGNRTTMHVTAENYETVVTELDRKFHMGVQKSRMEAAASAQVEASRKPPRAKAKPKAAVKKTAKAKPKAKAKGRK
ncbi:hypothetical protein L0Y65_01545 [Candidatus Micrarchaeota archaeon]|nr:hypothetical protein [Candidatus Micrarchaeota archaeon]